MMEIKDTRLGITMDKEGRKKSNKLLIEYFLDIIEKNKPTCTMEIGAFSAEFTRDIKIKYPEVKTFAFEANPYNFEFFSKKYEFEKKEINYINKAISDKEEIVTFNIQIKINDREIDRIRGNNSIIERNQENTDYEKVSVNATSLSDFIKENSLENEKIILWVDVEGANEKLLKGSKNILDKVDMIFIEVEEKQYWKDQWLESDVNDFLTKNNFNLIARDGEYEFQYNQIYINKNIKNF